jgi:acyl-CoA hydrolase
MGKSAFIAATRHCRAAVVMAATRSASFKSQIFKGEVIDMAARVTATGRTSMTVVVDCWAENLMRGERREAARGEFVMVALDDRHRPMAVTR